RNQGRPISRMRGRREFYSLTYYLNDHTLDPRPDSECLIDEALAYARSLSAERRPLRCLDLGTGTGCLLLSLLHHLPEATGLGVDLAPLAVAQARANAAYLGLNGRARFICSDWLDAVQGRFDLILANPPYIGCDDRNLARDVADYDPALALFAGPDGLSAYAELLPQIPGVLAADGRLFLEVGTGQAQAVTQLAEAAGLRLCAVATDLAGRDRCLILRKK
ncbi:MAG: peptide chain release factor N(5)-glutamine methyltransferase, partial [Pseudomonadota bacterium]|nr:peptide chain release factor N(5)-glutamine methyltransferase [Pseudomonadota bacterium]